MWMSTSDAGLVAATCGPCRVSAKVAAGSAVELIEETDYPFSDHVRLTVHTKEPVAFPIYLRIPKWASSAELTVSGEAARHHPTSGAFFKIDRQWKSGDVVTLAFNFKVRTETRKNNAVAIAWGPLYFVLRIGESFKNLSSLTLGPTDTVVPTPPGCANWQITSTTDWNYALVIDRQNPQCMITTNRISSMPFAQRGELVKRPGASEFAPWHEDVPIVFHVKARRVPQWGMSGANAAAVPVSPVHVHSLETLVELIPYGCSRLRIAEFPTV